MIFGKPLSRYVAFAAPFLILVPLVGILRLGLSLSGLTYQQIWWCSMTIVGFIGTVYFGIRVHTSGFGSYKQLLVVVALQNVVTQLLTVAAIVLGILTGTNNVFTVPEVFNGGDGRSWLHVGAHLTIGMIAGSLVPWGVGSLVLLVTRKLAGPRPLR